jgi:hypothetical protein
MVILGMALLEVHQQHVGCDPVTEISDAVVRAAKQADHEEGVRDGRSYHEVADHQVRRLIAGAVIAERKAMQDGLYGLLMGPVWQWAMSMVPDAKSTYGVDVVGKIATIVRAWPDTDAPIARIPVWVRDPSDVPHVVKEAVAAERERIRRRAHVVGATFLADQDDGTQYEVPFAAVIDPAVEITDPPTRTEGTT